jgi:hypothetical protein
MAKQNLPSVEGGDEPRRTSIKPGQEIASQPGTTITSVPASEGYIPRNVDVKMTRAQAAILRDKLRELQDAGAKTQDGRYVTNRAQAVRWIIENEVKV